MQSTVLDLRHNLGEPFLSWVQGTEGLNTLIRHPRALTSVLSSPLYLGGSLYNVVQRVETAFRLADGQSTMRIQLTDRSEESGERVRSLCDGVGGYFVMKRSLAQLAIQHMVERLLLGRGLIGNFTFFLTRDENSNLFLVITAHKPAVGLIKEVSDDLQSILLGVLRPPCSPSSTTTTIVNTNKEPSTWWRYKYSQRQISPPRMRPSSTSGVW